MPRHLPLPLNPHTNYPFHLQKNLEGRQDFRWRKLPNDYHSVILNGALVHIRQTEDRLTYRSTPDADLTDLLTSYFRLDDDLDAIYTEITARDDHIAKLIQEYPGVRLMRQPDPWECLVSYICSARAAPQESPTASRDCHPTGPPANPRRRDPPHLPRPRNRPHRRPRPTATNTPRLPARPPRHHPGRPTNPRRPPRPTPPRPTRHPLRRSHLPPNRPLLRRPQNSQLHRTLRPQQDRGLPRRLPRPNHRQETLPVPNPLHRRPNSIVGPRPLRPPRRLRQPVPLHGLTDVSQRCIHPPTGIPEYFLLPPCAPRALRGETFYLLSTFSSPPPTSPQPPTPSTTRHPHTSRTGTPPRSKTSQAPHLPSEIPGIFPVL